MTIFFILFYTHLGVFIAGMIAGDILAEFNTFRERALAFFLVVAFWPVVLWLICKQEK